MQTPTPLSILEQYWGHRQFRPMQEEIIAHVLSGKDTLALLPTGGGKSICFQVPALLLDGLCLVISPLIALMRDQVQNLEKRGIAAAAIYSGMPFNDVRSTLQEAAQGTYRFLYLSPERLESPLFHEWLPALNIQLIAVDEAHCISQWGYDFRPPYQRIANLRNELPQVPLIALTASATPLVQEDIIRSLRLEDYRVFRQSFARPALSYSSIDAQSKAFQLTHILNRVPGQAIVYCNSRKQTRSVSQLLETKKISTHFYHAGLTQEERQQRQQDWLNETVRVMVCTNAFGMGIDKPNVRLVVHYNMPDCLENYYQEAGRAGRDGQRAYAVLLYEPTDIEQAKELPDTRYPSISTIQHVYQCLADYFQLPVGSGEGAYYDFDLPAFCTAFKLDAFTALNALKVLEQEGHISVAESIFLPAQIRFLTDKDSLYAFEAAHPQYSDMIRSLLRTYQGIFDDRTSVFEKQLAYINRISLEETIQLLEGLRSFGIIEYLPKKDTPQIHYLLNRAPAKYLHIDHERYLQRKQLFTQRLEDMIRYATSTNGCRSQFIGQYFGDEELKECGICDHCLAVKRKVSGTASVQHLTVIILKMIKQQSFTAQQLTEALKTYSADKIWESLEYLQQEGKLQIMEDGMISAL